MRKNPIIKGDIRHHASIEDPLTEVLRNGARQLLGQAINVELEALLEATSSLLTDSGHRRVGRNGYLPERTVQTGIGPVDLEVPRVRDRAPTAKGAIKFTPKMLPRYLRKTRSLEALIPWLYLEATDGGLLLADNGPHPGLPIDAFRPKQMATPQLTRPSAHRRQEHWIPRRHSPIQGRRLIYSAYTTLTLGHISQKRSTFTFRTKRAHYPSRHSGTALTDRLETNMLLGHASI